MNPETGNFGEEDPCKPMPNVRARADDIALAKVMYEHFGRLTCNPTTWEQFAGDKSLVTSHFASAWVDMARKAREEILK